jgi:alpha-D-ribose 1-methylphosphonate 5-triphosphate synthase subunit PhnH
MNRKHSFDHTVGSQEVFRILLNALSNPGRLFDMSQPASRFAQNGMWLAIAATLLDNEVTYHWNGSLYVGQEIEYLTGSVPAKVEEADFIMLPEQTEPGKLLPLVKTGTHEAPHTSATVLAGSFGEQNMECTLRGPGIPPTGRHITLTQYEREWALLRDGLGYEYPLGIELIFIRGSGELFAVTRKAAVEWHM